MALRGKYKALDLKTKVEILQKVRNGGISKSQIASQYGIKPNTLSTYLKNEKEIMEAFEKQSFGQARKRMRTAAHQDLEEALIMWMKDARSRNYALSGPILMEKADNLALRLGIENFKCSRGWLERFRKRHNIVYRALCGESADVSETECDEWRKKVPELIRDYDPKDVFNIDETGLFFKNLPNKTLTFKADACFGGKSSKERVTVLLGSNMDGSEKLKPLVIGKYAKPRCFKGIRTFPVDYAANKKAWITMDIFSSWIRNLDRQFKRQNRKVLVFLDNASAHCEMDDLQAIKLMFLPANTTSKLQPLDQGIIQNLKVNYRKRLLQRVLCCMESQKEYDVNLLSAIHLISFAWEQVSKKTISNSFRHAGFKIAGVEKESTEESLTEECVESLNEELLDGMTFQEYVSIDDNLETCGPLSKNYIVSAVKESNGNRPNESSASEDEEQEECPPTTKDIADAIDCLKGFIQTEDSADVELKCLYKIEQLSLRSCAKRKKNGKNYRVLQIKT